MAMQAGGGGGGPMAEINVTPMADVMIVLLIIFMVTVPLLRREVDLPAAAHAHTLRPETLQVTLHRDGGLRVGGRPALLDELQGEIEERSARATLTLELQADQALPYPAVAAVIAACRRAGITEVALATAPEVLP